MTLELIELTALGDSRYRLTLRLNQCVTSHIVTRRKDFVSLLTDIDDVLRPIFINNPRALQEIFQAIRQTEAGKPVVFPLRLTTWEESLLAPSQPLIAA